MLSVEKCNSDVIIQTKTKIEAKTKESVVSLTKHKTNNMKQITQNKQITTIENL